MISENSGLFPVSVIGVGKSVPNTVITNEDLSQIVETTNDWIESRTGIKERRVVSGNESAASLAINAAKDAMEFAGVKAEEIDIIIAATSVPDNLYPSVACEVQGQIGALNAVAFDIVAACTGFVYGINIINSFIASGTYKTALLIGVDVHSRAIDWTDRSTCVLFGDGAGAAILRRSEDHQNDIISVDVRADGRKASELAIPLNGKNCPLVEPNDDKKQFVYMNGREIYKFAVSSVPDSIMKALEKAGMDKSELDYLVPHQANKRIIAAFTDRLEMKPEQVVVNLDRYGNTSAASIPIAFSEAVSEGKIAENSKVALCGFGAGLTWGTAIINWRAKDKRLV